MKTSVDSASHEHAVPRHIPLNLRVANHRQHDRKIEERPCNCISYPKHDIPKKKIGRRRQELIPWAWNGKNQVYLYSGEVGVFLGQTKSASSWDSGNHQTKFDSDQLGSWRGQTNGRTDMTSPQCISISIYANMQNEWKSLISLGEGVSPYKEGPDLGGAQPSRTLTVSGIFVALFRKKWSL